MREVELKALCRVIVVEDSPWEGVRRWRRGGRGGGYRVGSMGKKKKKMCPCSVSNVAGFGALSACSFFWGYSSTSKPRMGVPPKTVVYGLG